MTHTFDPLDQRCVKCGIGSCEALDLDIECVGPTYVKMMREVWREEIERRHKANLQEFS